MTDHLKEAEARTRIEQARDSIDKIGEGDWTPQDTHLARMLRLAEALLDERLAQAEALRVEAALLTGLEPDDSARSSAPVAGEGSEDGPAVNDGRASGSESAGADRLFELAAEVARLVCVRDAQYVDDPEVHKRLDLAANEIGVLLRLREPEFAELWERTE